MHRRRPDRRGVVTDMAILSVSETHRLDALEGVIERGKAAFVEVGEALLEPDQLRLLSVSELRTKAEYEMRQGQARYLNGKAWDRIVKVAEARGASDDDAIGTVLSEDEVADLVDRGYIDAQAAS